MLKVFFKLTWIVEVRTVLPDSTNISKKIEMNLLYNNLKIKDQNYYIVK